MKTTRFGPPDETGRRAVFWLHQYNDYSLVWVHKGWLMPEVGL